MTEAEYLAAVDRAADIPGHGVRWNERFLEAVSENGLRLVPATGAPPQPYIMMAPLPVDGEPNGWGESWLVPATYCP